MDLSGQAGHSPSGMAALTDPIRDSLRQPAAAFRGQRRRFGGRQQRTMALTSQMVGCWKAMRAVNPLVMCVTNRKLTSHA